MSSFSAEKKTGLIYYYFSYIDSLRSYSLTRAQQNVAGACYRRTVIFTKIVTLANRIPNSKTFNTQAVRGLGGIGGVTVFLLQLVGRHLRTNPLDKYGV